MPDRFSRIVQPLGAMLIVFAAGACGGDTTSPSPSGPAVSSVDVEAPATTGFAGDTFRLTATPLDSASHPVAGRPAAVWSSEAPAVARVDSTGVVVAVGPGSTRIFAVIDGVRGHRSLTVFEPITSIALTARPRPVVPTAVFTVDRSVAAASGTLFGTDGRALSWSSSDLRVAYVEGDGMVTAVGPGTATITLTAVREGVTGSMDVHVASLAYRTVQFDGAWSPVHFACALTIGGQPWCWGGQLPDQQFGVGEDDVNVAVPTNLDTDLVFDSLSVGSDHACALDAAGQAYCWGGNVNGQLGDGTAESRWIPAAVSGGHAFASIEAGVGRTCALTAAGSAWCWGANDRGQFGDATTTYSSVPVPAVTGIPLATITLAHGLESIGGPSCGMGLNGVAYCWGANDYGQAGTGTRSATPIAPTPVASPAALVSVVAGGEHACGLTADGTALCWGGGGDAVLGHAVSYPGIDSIPAVVEGAPKFTKLRAGLGVTCGLTTAGTAYCWGRIAGASPLTLIAPAPLTELSVEIDNVCGIGTDHIAYCWSGTGPAHKVPGQS